MSSKKPTVDAKLEKLPHESFYYFLHDESSQRASDRQDRNSLGCQYCPTGLALAS